ncbi:MULTISPECIES: ATP-binding cassette domain-containing protein [Actinoalloteichus]|uniref:ABC transporter/Oligopeptide/dipeptide transporter, C-terminal region n=1 Tax=Actinoalloteichus fjordicus TaxID=1612552 RepID=A0AAC9LEL2_9PSEU|nr:MULTISPECIES: ATP-binding cassette domain-containing protein [Actinoalloteichus]APU16518.1 ABC transporter/Oligopeptide/dipeptide transporter, C-terminal region [Actinoalloteichus fjordicus]APU22586.1 ABC transporter/Oligopeptide/dipeptide transporter, C-terminal region [Actinoalloteichus sp. GBA129-24]
MTSPTTETAGTETAAGAVLWEARGLTRRFRAPRTARSSGVGRAGATTRTALSDVDLTIREGEALGIVGESGAGKSTLLRLLLALDRPDEGELHYRGAPLGSDRRSLRAFRRDVQVVFQDPRGSLNPRMPVSAIVAEPLRSLRIPGDHAARVREVLGEVGLGLDAADRYPHEFSGGQRQRIAIARALAPRPRVLVGDEPVSALDVSVRAQILDLLAGLAAEHAMTLVLVSHDLAVVGRLCPRVLVLHQGRVVETGPTERVYSTPEQDYTRRLLAAIPRLPAGVLAGLDDAGQGGAAVPATSPDATAEDTAQAPAGQRAPSRSDAIAPGAPADEERSTT